MIFHKLKSHFQVDKNSDLLHKHFASIKISHSEDTRLPILWVGGQRENAYVKDLNSYPPEKVF